MVLAALGALQSFAGLAALRRFIARAPAPAGALPPVTILKPVCGDERLLEEAIASFCTQAYPSFQLVIGAQDANDPALAIARTLQTRYPDVDIAIVINPALHGANRKISNLINMLPAAKHDLLVFADSDLHVRPDYLTQVVTTLLSPGTGLVTTICAGEAALPGFASRLGASHISHSFLPAALLAVALGRQDCLGNTMALRRDTLERVGGLHALVDHLADDNVLGSLVLRQGLAVRLAATLPVVTVQERTLGAVWQHEMRWARTIRALVPGAFALSILQYPCFWALIAVAASGGAIKPVALLAAVWLSRVLVAAGIDDSVRFWRARPAQPVAPWLLPLRDVMSAAEIIAAFANDEVVWRGHRMRAARVSLGTRKGFLVLFF